jgi:tetratricopeptide (TPR) repeat protein
MQSGVDHDQRVMSILAKARQQPPEQRDDFVRVACGNDSDLIRELADILLWEDRMGSFLQKPLLNLAEFARPFQAGEVISQRFEIVREIGHGGMGVVYEAFDRKRKQRIAIKAAKPGFQRLLSPELEGALQVRHHNICLVNEIHTAQTKDGEIDFLAMELLEGETLCARLLRGGRLPHDEARDIICQVCAGLRAAHDREVIHRDLKSANIILSQNSDGHRRAVITDFGLASGLTLPSGEMGGGTPAYMAPELWKGEKASKASDVYALGIVMYEMVTGSQPFASDGSGQGAVKRRLAPPSGLVEGLDSRWDSVILHCLDPLPRARPDATEIAARLRERSQSAAEVRIALEKVLRGSQSVGEFRIALEKTPWAAARPALQRVRSVVLASLAVLLVAACAVGIHRWRKSDLKPGFQKHVMTPLEPKITEKDTIVVGDFANRTGDAIFDETLKQALTAELGQSPFLNVLSGRKVSQTLRMMGHPANQPVTADVGLELCQRTGSKALLGGTISSLGNRYLIELNAIVCSTGDTLATEQGEATSKEDVLQALSRASSSLRVKLGESLPSVPKVDAPIAATTSSLEALKNYNMGIKTEHEKGYELAIPFMKRAIELDPNFAGAYSRLANVYFNLQQPSVALEYAIKAYQLRDRVTEREKLSISASYFYVTGEVEKQAQTYEMWIADYPRDFSPHGNLGANYADMGKWNKALAEFQEALRLAPDEVTAYENLALTYVNLNRLEEAKTTFDQAFAHKLDGGALRQSMYYLAFLRGDAAQMERQVAWGAGKPEAEDALLSMQSDTEAYYGRLTKARAFSRRAVDSAVRVDSKETAGLWQVNAALREAELGNTTSARQGVAAALALSPGRNVKVVAALTLARNGDASRAKTLAEELAKSYPTNTNLKVYWLPTINAAIELNKGKSSQALEYLEAAAPYELGQAGTSINYLYPAYVRGLAYLRANNSTAAAAEFQKLVDHSGIVANFVTGSLAHIQIGRAYAKAGDTAKARAAYQDFFTLWKDADPDIPIQKQARAEYAKLR